MSITERTDAITKGWQKKQVERPDIDHYKKMVEGHLGSIGRETVGELTWPGIILKLIEYTEELEKQNQILTDTLMLMEETRNGRISSPPAPTAEEADPASEAQRSKED